MNFLEKNYRFEEILDIVWKNREKSPAVWWQGEWWSYEKVNSLAADCEAKLRQSGFCRGERVALLLPNSPIVFAIAFAVWRIGGTIAPLNGRMNPVNLQNTIKMLDVSAVFVAHDAIKNKEQMEAMIGAPIIPTPLDTAFVSEIETQRAVIADDGDIAVIFSTSGTSGLPKAVPCSHKNLLADLQDIPEALPGIIKDDTVILNVLPNFHTFGSNISGFLGFAFGVKQVLVPNFIPAESTIEAIEQAGVNTLVVVPTLLNFLLAELSREGKRIEGIRFIVSGGDKLNVEIEERCKKYLGVGICEGYGLTECSPVVAVNPPSKDKILGTVGPALKHFETEIRDISGNKLDIHAEGVLWVRGPAVVKSYFRDETNTKERFDDQGWFNTRDVVRIDDNGYITIIDRATDIIIVGGFNVYPQEVEAVLCSHPAVHSAICVGEKNRLTGEFVKAFVILEKEAQVTVKELRDYCKDRLAHYKIPRRIGFVTEYPISQTGKVLRRELRERKIESKETTEFSNNPDRLENICAKSWENRADEHCIWWEDNWWSWNKLNALADECVEKLQKAGFGKGQRLALLLPNSPSMIALTLACWRLGGAVAPLNARAGIINLLDTIKMLDVHTLIVSPELKVKAVQSDIQLDVPIIALDPAKGITEDWTGRQGIADSIDTAVIFSTSGTSGNPKAVPCMHENLLDNISCIRGHIIGLVDPEKSIFLNVLPNFHTFGFGCAQTLPLVCGVRQAIVSNFVPVNNTIKAIIASGVNAVIAVPTILAFLLSALEKTEMKLKMNYVVSGGDKLNTKLDERCKKYLGVGIIEGYGLTECSPVVAVGRTEASKKLGKVGEFLKSYSIEIRDSEGNKIDLHDEGVLWVKGASVVKEYFRDEVNTKERFKDGWFNTGDVVRIDEDGFVQIVDRATDIIIVSGFNVYPQEVEAVLCSHPGVHSAVCVGEQNKVTGEFVKAFIILEPDADVTEKELRDYCKARLAHYKVPRKIAFVTEYPISQTGKVLRRKLREVKIDNKELPEFEGNLDRIENVCAKVWKNKADANCIWWNGSWWSWNKLNLLAKDCEAKLTKAGFEKGQRLALLLPNSPACVALSLACWRIGGAVAPLNVRVGVSNLIDTIKMLDVHSIIISPELKAKIGETDANLDIPIAVLNPENGFDDEWKGRKGEPDTVDTAVIFSTSGTSGNPKAVPCTHLNLLDNIRCAHDHVPGITDPEETVFLNVLPNFHTFGFGCAQTIPLVCGMRQAIVSNFVPVPNTIKAIIAAGVNAIIAVPTVLSFLLGALEKAEMKLKMRFVVSGGDKLNTKLEERCKKYLGTGIIEGYGLTECSPVVAVGSSEADKKLGKVGKIYKSYSVEIRDREGNKIGLHDEGVLWLKGASVVKSYFRDEANTNDRFKDGWFNTGDVVRIDEEGYLQVVDRATDIIIVSGFNVYPQEVEKVLCEHPAVQSAVCVGEKNNVAGELVKAFIILKEGANAIDRELMTYCKERLAHYKVPRKIGFVTEYPISPTGKILRRELRKMKIGKNS